MTKGFWIVMSNSGGELDRRFVEHETDLPMTMHMMLRDCGTLAAGDKFEIVEGESETT